MNQLITVMTYNVHEAVGKDGRRDYRRIGKVIGEIDPDIITLQEVDSNLSESDRQQSYLFETISRMFNYFGVKGITMIRPRSAYGNAIFLRNKPEEINRHDISYENREPRGLIDCSVRIKNQSLRIMNTHLGLKKRERRVQLGILQQLLKLEKNDSTILSGDFNEWLPFSRYLKKIREEMNMVPHKSSFPARFPLLPLDRIYYKGNIRLIDAHIHKSPLSHLASDHLPLIAKFVLF